MHGSILSAEYTCRACLLSFPKNPVLGLHLKHQGSTCSCTIPAYRTCWPSMYGDNNRAPDKNMTIFQSAPVSHSRGGEHWTIDEWTWAMGSRGARVECPQVPVLHLIGYQELQEVDRIRIFCPCPCPFRGSAVRIEVHIAIPRFFYFIAITALF